MSKPKAKLIGENGNVFNLIAIAIKSLKKANQHDKVDELAQEIFDAEDYKSALKIIQKYVEVV